MISYLGKENKKIYCFGKTHHQRKLSEIFSPGEEMREGPHFLPETLEGGKEAGGLRTLW